MVLNTTIFPITGKKHNKSSVSDADREIPTSGQRKVTGNPVNRHYPFSVGLGFLGLYCGSMKDSIDPGMISYLLLEVTMPV